jgi:ubiquinone/menaquinone biosynthesis C-methylase UbiE
VERRAWLDERRRVAEERFDTLHAPTYDQDDIPITPTHRRFVTALLERCPPAGRVLDAACGTGKYFGMVLESGRTAFGIDQSAGMLAVAHAKHPGVETMKLGLQEMAFDGEFDGAMCIDAMENVFPEDWPVVLGNLTRATRPRGPIYFTVETIEQAELDRVFEEAQGQGLPVVPGEHHIRGGGYHFYPSREQVSGWIAGAGLHVLEQGRSEGGNYGYDHYLCASG